MPTTTSPSFQTPAMLTTNSKMEKSAFCVPMLWLDTLAIQKREHMINSGEAMYAAKENRPAKLPESKVGCPAAGLFAFGPAGLVAGPRAVG